MTSEELAVISFLIFVLIFVIVGLYNKNTNAICKSKRRLDGRTAVVTGGTAGMGLEIAIDFAARGARVIVACPFEGEGKRAEKFIKEQTESDKVFFKLLDLASFASVRDFASAILKNEERLDILVNNAGIGAAPRIDAVTRDGLNMLLQVNYFGHFLLTLLLLPLLKKTGKSNDKSRIVNVSSVLHNCATIDTNNLTKLTYYPWPIPQSYMNSKAFMVLFSRELCVRLKEENVVVNSVDPGAVGSMIFVPVAFFGIIFSYMYRFLAKNVWEGAQTSIFAAVDEKISDVSGKHLKECRISEPNRYVQDDALSKKVWDESIRLVKISEEELKLANV